LAKHLPKNHPHKQNCRSFPIQDLTVVDDDFGEEKMDEMMRSVELLVSFGYGLKIRRRKKNTNIGSYLVLAGPLINHFQPWLFQETTSLLVFSIIGVLYDSS